jgi:hypothetical protein
MIGAPTPEPSDLGAPPRVFISYAHDSVEHRDLVRALWLLLRANGIDAKIRRPVSSARTGPDGWRRVSPLPTV